MAVLRLVVHFLSQSFDGSELAWWFFCHHTGMGGAGTSADFNVLWEETFQEQDSSVDILFVLPGTFDGAVFDY